MKNQFKIEVKNIQRSIEFYNKFFSITPDYLENNKAEYRVQNLNLLLNIHEAVEVTSNLELKIIVGSDTKIKLWSNFLYAKGIEISPVQKLTNGEKVIQFITVTDPDNNLWTISSINPKEVPRP